MFHDTLTVYGPTSTQLQGLRQNDKQCRQRIRILQVRSQAKKNAKQIREKYQLKKSALQERITQKLQTSIESQLSKLLDTKLAEYEDCLTSVGSGHASALSWQDPKAEREKARCLAQEQAAKRFTVALQAHQAEEELRKRNESEPRRRLAEVRAIEQERAQLIASLPKPAPPPYNLDVPTPAASTKTVMVLDVESQNTAAAHSAPSTLLVTTENARYSDQSSIKVDDAVSAARLEEDRQAMEQQISYVRAKEELIKADVRGHEALKRERVQRHYRTLLDRMNELSRGDTARLRSEAILSKPANERTINRRLEKVFENEILRQLSDNRQVNSDQFPNSLTHATLKSRLSVCDESDENAEVLDDILIDEGMHRGVFTSLENFAEELRADKTAPPVSSPKPAWTPHNAIATSPILVDDGSISSGSSNLLVHGTPKTPFISPVPEAKSLSDPCLSISDEGNLRPGVKSLDSDEGQKLSSASPLQVQPVKEHGNLWTHTNTVVYPNEQVMHGVYSSSSDAPRHEQVTPRSSIAADLAREQALLDEQLATIESRLNTLRMAAATDAHIKDSRMSNQRICGREPAETLVEQTTAKQVTPRDTYIVEGFAAEDHLVKSSREADQPLRPLQQPLLQRLPRNCIDQLATLVRKQISALRAPQEMPSLTTPTIVSSSPSMVHSESASELEDSPYSSLGTLSGETTPRPQSPSSSTKTSPAYVSAPTEDLSEPVPELQTNPSHVSPMHERSSSSSAAYAMNDSPDLLEATLESRANACSSTKVHPAPRLSLTGLSADERSVLNSVHKLAARLTNVAICEASKELASASAPPDSSSLPPLPTSSVTLPPMKSQTGNSKSSPSSSSGSTKSEIRATLPTTQPNQVNSSDPSHTFSSDALKSELRTLLTSSLINSLLSQTTDSTISSNGLSGLDVLRRVLHSHSNPITSETSLDPQPTQTLLTSGDTNFVGLSEEAAALTSPSSVSTTNSMDLRRSSSVLIPVMERGSSPVGDNVPHPTPATGDELEKPCLSERASLSKEVKKRFLRDYITVNKDWLLNLAGQNTKPKSSSSTSSQPSSSSSQTSSCFSPVFRHLSVADGESDGGLSSPRELDGTTAEPSTAFTSSSLTSNQHRPQLSTPSWHSLHTTFKPLPRLEEATSEDSIQSSLAHLPVLAENDNAAVDASRTPSSTWSDSRKSASEFASLSRCSTSNSNLESIRRSTPNPDASVDSSPASCLSSSVERKSTSDDTTLHQLRKRVPSTPAEPREVDVVPYLGSNMSSVPHPDSFVPEAGEDNSFCMLNEPPSARPSYQAECPPGVTTQTRTTTTIDSSMIWDDADLNGSRDTQQVVASNGVIFIPSQPDPQPTPETQPSGPNSPTKEPRPSTPAEGAVAQGPRNLTPRRLDGSLMFQSLPTVFVDCESESPTKIQCVKKPISHNDLILYASWSNFNGFQAVTEVAPSVSDSLRSFQRHEESCLLADDILSPDVRVEVPEQHPGEQNPRPFLESKPDQIDSHMVRQNAQKIRSVASPLSKPASDGRSTTARPSSNIKKTPTRARWMDSTASSRRATINSEETTRQSRNPTVPAVSVTKSCCRRPSTHVQSPVSTNRRTTPTVKLTLESNLARPQFQPDTSRTAPQCRLEKRSVHGAVSEVAPKLTLSPSCRPYSTNSGVAKHPTDVEQSLLQKLDQWRAVRFGIRKRADSTALISPPASTSTSVPCSTTPGCSLQFPLSATTAFSEHAAFAPFHSGSPPRPVERSFLDESSSPIVLVNEVSVPATLDPRPSTPTPAETGRPSTSSDEYSATPYQTGPNVDTNSPIRFTNYHGGELPSTACAGDEVPANRRHGATEVRFAVPAPSDGRLSNGTTSRSHNLVRPSEPNPPDRTHSNLTERTIHTSESINRRTRHPSGSRVNTLPTSYSAAADLVRATKFRISDERKQRDEQARLNRLRVKEFDRLRRERSLRQQQNKIPR